MTVYSRYPFVVGLLTMLAVGAAGAAEQPESRGDNDAKPDAAEQVAQLKAKCRDAAEEIERRQAENSLYERLGGRKKIRALTGEIVRLHLENEKIDHIFNNVDTTRLAEQVADFMVVGYGGEGEYNGRDMTTAHAHLGITDAHFLAAGSDIKTALGNFGYGEQVTQEVICSLMPFHEEVVTR